VVVKRQKACDCIPKRNTTTLGEGEKKDSLNKEEAKQKWRIGKFKQTIIKTTVKKSTGKHRCLGRRRGSAVGWYIVG